jgi:hypothetical protein
LNVRSILAAFAWLAAAVAASPSGAAPAGAGNWTFHGFEPPATFTGEAGLRFGVGKAKTGKNLFDTTGTALLSRLTYDNLTMFPIEAFWRLDLNTGWFVKGFVGGGGFRKGTLQDEDFPPGISPYSATLSTLDNAYLLYATFDGGYNVVRGADFRVGAFVGYNFLRQNITALGCNQIATNPFICGFFPIPQFIKGISIARPISRRASSSTSMAHFCPWCGSPAPMRIGCASASFRAISTGRFRRRAGAGAISSKRFSPIR